VPGATVVLAGSDPVLYLERGGKALQTLVDADDPRIPAALQALADHARAGRIKRIALERVDGEPVMGTRWEPALAAVGFRGGPRKLTLSA
jgi:ATP-dependent Lhr-like helicase